MKLNYRISQSKKGQPPGKSRQPTPFGPSRPPFRARVHIAFSVKLWYAAPSKRAGPAPKGGKPMSVTDTIALLMLVIAAVSLGYGLKK